MESRITPSQTSLAGLSGASERASVVESVAGLAELRRFARRGDPAVRIAVLDGPVNLAHPCLAPAAERLRRLPTLVPEAGSSDHGTHVTSVIFSAGADLMGIAPQCSGLILPVFAQGSNGLLPCSQTDLARAITQAVSAGAHVINISGGEVTETGEAIDFLQDAVQQAVDQNVLIVAAVGNGGCDCPQVPATLPGVLAVGAIDADGQPLGSSNWGEKLSQQGVMAPGAEVLGASGEGGMVRMTGTSFATPIVSGIAALLVSLQLQRGGELDPAAVRRAILHNVRPCDRQTVDDCLRALAGYLNVPAASKRILEENSMVEPAVLRSSIVPSQREESVQPNPITTGDESMSSEQSNLLAAIAPEGESSAIEPSVAESCACESSAVAPSADDSSVAASQESAALVVPNYSGMSPTHVAAPAAVESAGVSPSSCEGGSSLDSGQRVYVLGNLYYDFGTEARRDYFVSQMAPDDPWKVYNPMAMAKFLTPEDQAAAFSKAYATPDCGFSDVPSGHPEDANGLIWTLYIDSDPVYAILPQDQYAMISYATLIHFLIDQVSTGKGHEPEPGSKTGSTGSKTGDGSLASQTARSDVFRVGIAGHITGSTQLMNGTVVPTLAPVSRGMYDWTIESLTESLGIKSGTAEHQALTNLLRRMYYDLRNLGISGQDRAKNFAATNVWQLAEAVKNGLAANKQLDKISTAPSPICRRNSECWDISLTLFDPTNVYAVARDVFLFTVDVSDVVPVQVGKARTWATFSDPLAG